MLFLSHEGPTPKGMCAVVAFFSKIEKIPNKRPVGPYPENFEIRRR
ncbi:conserved hypothetical protein [delta proteobacterium NaphS2]|nr:conserved hypothetical protein [delta proteobacterium NaphS2]